MRRRMTGLNATLLIYSFVITLFLILAFILYIKLIPAPRLALPGYLADLNNSNILSSIERGAATIPLNTITGIVARDQIENMYFSAMLKDLPALLIAIIFIFVAGAVVLSHILQRQQEKQSLLLARQLYRIDDSGGAMPGHPDIAKAYSEIKNRLAANTIDYMRLSSYVTHEQKNILSLLRAKLQLSGNSELIADVDKAVNSLDDILTLSASVNDAGREIIDAAFVCADVCDEYRKVFPDIVFDFDESANYQVAARELWINRAVSNLLNNAIKHGKGRINVAVSNKKGA